MGAYSWFLVGRFSYYEVFKARHYHKIQEKETWGCLCNHPATIRLGLQFLRAWVLLSDGRHETGNP